MNCDGLEQPYLSLAVPKPFAALAGWNRPPVQVEENLAIAWGLDAMGVVSYCEECSSQTLSGVIFHAPLDAAHRIPAPLLVHTKIIDWGVLRPFG
jgi:hypothetical protein